MTAPLLLSAALTAAFAAPMPHPDPGNEPTLTVSRGDNRVSMNLLHPTQIFAGVVIASLSPELSLNLPGLPPLLDDYVVLGGGVGYPDGGVTVSVRETRLPEGVEIFLQGVTVTESVEATSVVDLFR